MSFEYWLHGTWWGEMNRDQLCWVPKLLRSIFGKPIRVTFDSNTWQMVVRPDIFLKNPKYKFYLQLNRAVRCGRIQGYLVDVLATLEAIPKGQRGSYLASAANHPGLVPILIDRLEEAKRLNFKLMHAPRIGLEIPKEVEDYYIVQSGADASLRQDHSSHAIREIENIGVGKVQIEAIGQRISSRLGEAGHWSSFLNRPLDATESNEIDEAVGEWADEDALAAHYGYQFDYFCTEDFGKGAVKRFGQSILDPARRAQLNTDLGIKFVSIEELVALL